MPHQTLSLTKIDFAPAGSPVGSGLNASIPPSVRPQYVTRIRALAALAALIMIVMWAGIEAIQGTLIEEFTRLHDWLPPVVAIVSSLAVIGISFVPRISIGALLRVALVYFVVMSFAVAFSVYWGAWIDVPASFIDPDRVGIIQVALWMLVFAVVVPVPLKRAALPYLASAAAVPIVYWLSSRADLAPTLDAGLFFLTFVLPYLVTAAMAGAIAGIIYRLRRDVSRAKRMGSYRLDELLGRGGMGEVWRASHRLLARPAAVKLINQDMLGRDPETVGELMVRFDREAQATARLRSPHTVELYDYGMSDDGDVYYVMEYLEGVDLHRLVREVGPLPAERVIHILKQSCASLAEAHQRQLIHRDIKPANIYLCQQALEYDFVKILDFGLVKRHSVLEAQAGGSAEEPVSELGKVVGTPGFMAPEIALQQEPIDGRADLYSLGCVAYWLLTGAPVFDAPSPAATMFAHVQQKPPRPSERAPFPVPPELDALILQTLAKSPTDRPESAEAVARSLAEIRVADPWTDERAGAWWQEHNATAATD